MNVWYDGFFERLETLRDTEQSVKMAAYMQNKFDFLGLPKPVRNTVLKPLLKAGRKLPFDWDFVLLCWEKPYREAQYAAVSYVLAHENEFLESDIDRIKFLVTEKSWWDTVDMLDGVCGTLVEKHPSLKLTMLEWSYADNTWLRRASIDHQQKYKEKTDTELLEKIIVNNLGSTEFFINKAIGWSLREYSKTNSAWVRDFLEKHKNGLSSISRREASKYLMK